MKGKEKKLLPRVSHFFSFVLSSICFSFPTACHSQTVTSSIRIFPIFLVLLLGEWNDICIGATATSKEKIASHYVLERRITKEKERTSISLSLSLLPLFLSCRSQKKECKA